VPQNPGAPLTLRSTDWLLMAVCSTLHLNRGVGGWQWTGLHPYERWSWGRDGQLGLFQDTQATVPFELPLRPYSAVRAGPETLTLNLFTRRLGWLLQVSSTADAG